MEIIVGKTAGFCYGVKNAVNGLNKECENEKIDCLGEIVHNEEVCNNFKNKGVNFINDVKESKNKVVIRAHGVPKEVYNYLENNNIKYKDLTCPKVLKVHDICNQYKDDYFIFIIGSKMHPEIIGTKSFCKNYFIIENEAGDILGIEVKGGSHVGKEDFKHLSWFKDNLINGRNFKGIVLYSGENTISFGKDLLAVPTSSLWNT